MVLDHVAQRADGVVEPAAALDAEVLGHRDLHAGHALAVPQLGQRQVGEPQVFQLDDRLLAEEVIDAQDLALAQQPVQPGVQLAGRRQVAAERLLDRDPAVAQQLRRAELLHDRAEQGRGHLQVVHAAAAAADPGGEAAVERGVADVSVQVGHPAGEPVEDRVVDVLTALARWPRGRA